MSELAHGVEVFGGMGSDPQDAIGMATRLVNEWFAEQRIIHTHTGAPIHTITTTLTCESPKWWVFVITVLGPRHYNDPDVREPEVVGVCDYRAWSSPLQRP